jgi:dynein heavy chain
LSVKPAPPESA